MLLKGENRRLREDNEILKAASVFFAGVLATPCNRLGAFHASPTSPG